MLLKFHIPDKPLSDFVQLFTFYEGLNHQHSIERLLPDGTVNIIIELDNIPKYIYDNETLDKKEKFVGAWVSGMHKEYISIGAPTGSSMFVIQFKPGGAYPFFDLPLEELNNSVVEADLIFGRAIHLLREQLLEECEPVDKFRRAEEWLMEHLSESLFSEKVLRFAIQKICHEPTLDSIEFIARKTGYSQKQFIHLFKKYVGPTPKFFQRIQRFNNVLEELELRNEINWPALSYDCGFYDQSHFIREFQKFSGFNPGQYLRVKGDYINYVPVG